jgi:hypothetical protein
MKDEGGRMNKTKLSSSLIIHNSSLLFSAAASTPTLGGFTKLGRDDNENY